MPSTLADTCYDALYDLLTAANTITVPIEDSTPPARIPDEYILLVGITNGAKNYAQVGAGGLSPQREQFDIDAEIHAYVGGSNRNTEPKRVRTRAFELMRSIDDVIQAHLDLGLDAVNWAVLSGYSLEQGAVTSTAGGGRNAVLKFTVTVQAYLPR